MYENKNYAQKEEKILAFTDSVFYYKSNVVFFRMILIVLVLIL